MLRLSPKTKIKLKITKRYLQKLDRFSLSYFDLCQKYANLHAEIPLNASSKQEETLETTLIQQIESSLYSKKDKNMLLFLVDSLDEHGLLSTWKTIKNQLKNNFKISERKAYQILDDFQKLEPTGVGATNIANYLKFQIKNYGLDDENFIKLASNILDYEKELIEGKIDEIAAKLNSSKKNIENALYFIKNNITQQLPSQLYSKNTTTYIHLSAKIYKTGEYLKTDILEDYSNISDSSILKDLKERSTLLTKILNYLLLKQSIKFLDDISQLRPITQKDIAEKLNVSPSLISRLVNRKYILLQSRTILLSELIKRDLKKNKITSYYLQQIFQQYPSLTDKKISQLLLDRNIKLSRRMINYYRNKFKTTKKIFIRN